MESSEPFSWTGRDGQVYVVTQIENRHLLYAHRLFCELQEQWEKEKEKRSILGQGALIIVEDKITQYVNAIQKTAEEIQRRGLTPLPLRPPERRARNQSQDIGIENRRAREQILRETEELAIAKRNLARLREEKKRITAEAASLQRSENEIIANEKRGRRIILLNDD